MCNETDAAVARSSARRAFSESVNHINYWLFSIELEYYHYPASTSRIVFTSFPILSVIDITRIITESFQNVTTKRTKNYFTYYNITCYGPVNKHSEFVDPGDKIQFSYHGNSLYIRSKTVNKSIISVSRTNNLILLWVYIYICFTFSVYLLITVCNIN